MLMFNINMSADSFFSLLFKNEKPFLNLLVFKNVNSNMLYINTIIIKLIKLLLMLISVEKCNFTP